MQINIKKLWFQYVQYYLDNYSPTDISKEMGLAYFRDKMFISILLFSIPICILVYIPSIIVSFATNEYLIGACDAIALLFVLFIGFDKQQSLASKKIFFSVIFYLLAVVMIVSLGIEGPGMLIIICTSILITLYHSLKAGLISVFVNAIIFTLVFVLLDLKTDDIEFFHKFSIDTWIGIGLNLIAFNTLVILGVGSLIDQLNGSLL